MKYKKGDKFLIEVEISRVDDNDVFTPYLCTTREKVWSFWFKEDSLDKYEKLEEPILRADLKTEIKLDIKSGSAISTTESEKLKQQAIDNILKQLAKATNKQDAIDYNTVLLNLKSL